MKNTTNQTNVGPKLRQMRLSKNLLLSEVGESCGLGIATITRIESGTCLSEGKVSKLVNYYEHVGIKLSYNDSML